MPSASEAIAEQLSTGGPVRISGAGTKLGWGRPVAGLPTLSTASLDRIVAHDAGDFTAVLQAGVPLADAQETFAEQGQMLALDPPPGGTIGGVIATGDSGPLRHRYGAPRDLVIGVTLALADGTVARGGGRVIKNVAGYDLPKLAAGSYGTLGVITEVCVRLHPRPQQMATARIDCTTPHTLEQTYLDLLHRPIEAEALDVRWDGDRGAVLARFGGATATERAEAIGDVTGEDVWDEQRARQRGDLVVRVAALPGDLATILHAAPGATAVGRVGTVWLRLPADTDVVALRDRLPGTAAITDAPEALRAAVDPWGVPEGPALDLMRRLKERFDPAGTCNPGVFAGGI